MHKLNTPPYTTFPNIISDDLILREIHEEDVLDIINISFYDAKQALNVDEALEMQNKINLDYKNGSSIHWGIADRNTNKIVGTIGYYRGLEDGVGEIGCVLKPEFQGKGFMTKALLLIVEFGFNTIGLLKIIAITTLQNTSAIKLLERTNFIKIKELPDHEIEFKYSVK